MFATILQFYTVWVQGFFWRLFGGIRPIEKHPVFKIKIIWQNRMRLNPNIKLSCNVCIVALQKSVNLTFKKTHRMCHDDAKLVFNCWTAEQDNLIFASFSVCNVLGAWTNSFWVLIWRCCFSVTVVQEYLYPVVHEHVSYSSCNVMLMMCYFVLQTTASTTVGSNKEMLFINLWYCFCRYHTKWTCSSISM